MDAGSIEHFAHVQDRDGGMLEAHNNYLGGGSTVVP
ncbi:hypothetical protein L195_g025482, partial [Trifolium pratense]